MVFAVPAEHSGALSILEGFYNEVVTLEDRTINWIFILSIPRLKETKNIKILRFPWIKQSWFHRLYFDQVIAPVLIKKFKVNKIFSLQNIIIPRTSLEQIVYIHQVLPFLDYKFKFKANTMFWIYQNIIGKFIIKSIRNSDKVIVQTDWLKKSCVEKTGVNEDKISVVYPEINIDIRKHFIPNKETLSTFFYPAGPSTYKNHGIIVKACNILKKIKNLKYKVIFTLEGNESADIAKMYEEAKEKKLPIVFLGKINRNKVYEYYTKSILIFPSFIESFGLPLLEAKLHHTIILASNCSFSHEILDDYENKYYFNHLDEKELAELMISIIQEKINYKSTTKINNQRDSRKNSLVDCIIGTKHG
jgi:glycosyltransferase involved in cell wall biosynthesis